MTTCNNYCDSGKNDARLCRYCIGNLPEGDDNAAWCNDLVGYNGVPKCSDFAKEYFNSDCPNDVIYKYDEDLNGACVGEELSVSV